MIEELKRLVHLQEIDQELARLTDDVRRFEPALDGVKRDRARRASLKQKREQEISAAAAERRKLELELKDAESRLGKFRLQQEQVRTSKEAEALEHEVQAVESLINTLEEKILSLFDKEAQLAADHKLKLLHEERLEAAAVEEQQRLDTLRTEKLELAKALQGDRIAGANALDEDLRASYEWLRKRHGATAVARVRQGACTGCGNVLVAQMGFNAQAATALVQCPNCQRYLY